MVNTFFPLSATAGSFLIGNTITKFRGGRSKANVDEERAANTMRHFALVRANRARLAREHDALHGTRLRNPYADVDVQAALPTMDDR